MKSILLILSCSMFVYCRNLLTIFILLFTAETLYAQKDFRAMWLDSVMTLVNPYIIYDPSYVNLDYPNGDVAPGRGVCSDVVIRAYRKIGVDLQRLVHEDMNENFHLYPKNWGLTKPDKNIDHRRVPNLMTFFSRFGKELKKTRNAADYRPGEIVCWNLGGGITHIGIVSDKLASNGKRYLILHNIGGGQVLEDCLFRFSIIGHYDYLPEAINKL